MQALEAPQAAHDLSASAMGNPSCDETNIADVGWDPSAGVRKGGKAGDSVQHAAAAANVLPSSGVSPVAHSPNLVITYTACTSCPCFISLGSFLSGAAAFAKHTSVAVACKLQIQFDYLAGV